MNESENHVFNEGAEDPEVSGAYAEAVKQEFAEDAGEVALEQTVDLLGAEEAKRMVSPAAAADGGMSPERVAFNLDQLREDGVAVDVGELVYSLEPMEVYANFNRLLRAGASADDIAARMPPQFVGFRLAELRAAGAKNIDVAALTSKIKPETALLIVDTLRKRGNYADSYEVASTLGDGLVGWLLPDLRGAVEYESRRNITNDQADIIARLYTKGNDPADIAKKLAISPLAVEQEISARGFAPNRSSPSLAA